MAITGLESVVFTAPNMTKAKEFFTDWGLKRTKNGKTGTEFQTAVGSRIVLKPKGTKNLPPAPAKGSNFREMVWGVSSKADLKKYGKALSEIGEVTVDKDGTVHGFDPNGVGVAFRLWKPKNPKGMARGKINSVDNRERVDEVAVSYDQASPIRMGHIVFMVPDMPTAETFWRDRLGFVESDRYHSGTAVFLRHSMRGDHHNIFFIQGPPGKEVDLHHIAFEVRDVHEVFGGGNAFASKGHDIEIGPGRHPISSAYFWYFKNPLGGAVEYFADCDYLTENWKPTAYKENRFSEWHLVDGLGGSIAPGAKRKTGKGGRKPNVGNVAS